MKDEKKVTFLDRELSLEDIKNIKSPVLREILKERFLSQSETTWKGCTHDKYSRFPYCGIMPND